MRVCHTFQPRSCLNQSLSASGDNRMRVPFDEAPERVPGHVAAGTEINLLDVATVHHYIAFAAHTKLLGGHLDRKEPRAAVSDMAGSDPVHRLLLHHLDPCGDGLPRAKVTVGPVELGPGLLGCVLVVRGSDPAVGDPKPGHGSAAAHVHILGAVL